MSVSDSELLKLFRTIIDYLPSGVSLADGNFRILVWNAEFKRLLKFPDDLFEPEAPDLRKLALFNARRGEYGPGEPEALAEAVVERARKMQPHVYERTRPDGTVLEIRGRPLPGGGFVSIYTDMTERKRAEETVRRTATYLQAVLNNLPFGVVVTDRELRCLYWNRQGEELFQLPSGFVRKEMPLEEVLHRVAESGYYGPGDPALQVAERIGVIGRFQPSLIELTRPDGRILQVRGAPVMMDEAPAGYILIQEDITERKSHQATLERLATTDHLTSLLNRRAFLESTDREIRRAHRYGQSLSLLMLDVDHFKRINDTYGHPAGDEALRRIASACRAILRDDDLIGRLGGEEFAIALVQAPLRAALVVAERLRKAIGELAIAHDGRSIAVTVSIGVVEITAGPEDIGHFISLADAQLYQAKANGRNRVCHAQPAQTRDTDTV